MVTVTISQGALKGGKCTTESGFEYLEFLGIPYAKPPVGELRFKSPQSPDPWDGVRDATTTDLANVACQIDFLSGSTSGSEDCLYLNVYTPKLPTSNSDLKPVMMLSHGGGFIGGNGILKDESGPDFLIENDVIIVTINYRLGPLGFMNLDIPEAAGNMGLKDHVKALQWIQNNIDKFGGDKDSVTIIGLSAGSAACEFLTISPLAKGLFHKCILQSGSCLNNWAINYPNTPKTLALNLAKEFGYTGADDDINAIYQVLLKAPAKALTGLAFQVAEKYTSDRVFFGFVPSIEQDFDNGDAFLTDHPYNILNEGRFNDVPIIKGFCNDEGILASMMKPSAVRELAEKKTFVNYWAYPLEDDDAAKYNPILVKNYVDNAKPADQLAEFAVTFFGDLNICAGIYLAGKLQSEKVPVYMYQFRYKGKLNTFQAMFGLMKEGAAHGDDVGYILRHIALASKIPDEADVLLRSRMTKMWTNFAKTGNPTPDNCTEVPLHWPAFKDGSQEYLNIDKEITIETNYEAEKMSVFEAIYDKYKK